MQSWLQNLQFPLWYALNVKYKKQTSKIFIKPQVIFLTFSSKSYKHQPITSNTLNETEQVLYPIIQDIQKNLLRLDFYFASQSRIVIKEDPVYPDLFSLFTNLGGALSLWMGISFLALMEILEVVFDRFLKMMQ